MRAGMVAWQVRIKQPASAFGDGYAAYFGQPALNLQVFASSFVPRPQLLLNFACVKQKVE